MDKISYLDEFISEQNLSKQDICIVGSFALELAGYREAGDIDIVLNQELRKERGFDDESATKVNGFVEVVRCGWAEFAGISDDQLIKDVELTDEYNGYRVISLDLLRQRKVRHCREKDYRDLKYLGLPVPVATTLPVRLKRQVRRVCSGVSRRVKSRMKQCSMATDCISMFRSRHLSVLVDGRYELATTPENLISGEYLNGRFNRYDTIVRLLAIESFYSKDTSGFELYLKMQKARDAPLGYHERYISLIQSVDRHGFDWKSFLELSKDGWLRDGSHRLALALHHDVPVVSARVCWSKVGAPCYDMKWFSDHGFTEHECERIHRRQEALFWEKGLYFSIVLWPSAASFFDEIERDIPCRVVRSIDYEYDETAAFESTVRSIYEMDDIAEWKVRKKLSHLAVYAKRVRVLWLEFPDPEYRKKKLNNADISQYGERLKRQIREKYRRRVPNYIYDIVCHTSDNSRHNKKMMKIFDIKPTCRSSQD
jgi:hypothetical protein|tara:strand:+ start:3176 stop:4624 length:1449 start_codon:yes stop_codon:yes gene_type:complete